MGGDTIKPEEQYITEDCGICFETFLVKDGIMCCREYCGKIFCIKCSKSPAIFFHAESIEEWYCDSCARRIKYVCQRIERITREEFEKKYAHIMGFDKIITIKEEALEWKI
jgi:hypothetical protein